MKLLQEIQGQSRETSGSWYSWLKESSVLLPVTGNDYGRNIDPANQYLPLSLVSQNFGFFDHESVYLTPILLATDRVHLSQSGERIFTQEIAGCRALTPASSRVPHSQSLTPLPAGLGTESEG